MTQLLTNRFSVLAAAALFAAATIYNSSFDNRTGSTSIVLSQPEALEQVAAVR